MGVLYSSLFQRVCCGSLYRSALGERLSLGWCFGISELHLLPLICKQWIKARIGLRTQLATLTHAHTQGMCESALHISQATLIHKHTLLTAHENRLIKHYILLFRHTKYYY